MPLKLDDKKAIVAEVNEVAAGAASAVAAEYRGLSVEEMDALRRTAREAEVYLKVVKNTLAKRAVAGTDFECMQEGLEGPLMLAFSRGDPASAARVVHDFAKQHDRLRVKLVAIGGRMLGPGEVARLATLPTREEALAQLMGVMRAPVEKLVRTLAEPQAKLARTLAAVREKKVAA
ncbi:MAG: 50S ribosomal protein L10 [Gammaproteobacteria bacterium]|nr:50S ribosomal protein L10 [Gammaproteobacteria bacterium]